METTEGRPSRPSSRREERTCRWADVTDVSLSNVIRLTDCVYQENEDAVYTALRTE